MRERTLWAAALVQFQFPQALCEAAMLAMGQSRPWPDALEAMTGQRRMDASALLAYFAPLQKWLDEQNRGKKVGW